MVGCQHHHERTGGVADKIAECGIDAQLLQLPSTERVANEFAHGMQHPERNVCAQLPERHDSIELPDDVFTILSSSSKGTCSFLAPPQTPTQQLAEPAW